MGDVDPLLAGVVIGLIAIGLTAFIVTEIRMIRLQRRQQREENRPGGFS